MSATGWLPTLTSILAILFAIALVDQWRTRRHAFQLVWAAGVLFLGIGAGCEAIAAAAGWSEPIYRVWYLTGAVWTAGWLGLGTAFLLARTRFGYTFAVSLFLAGLFTLLARKNYPDAGGFPLAYFLFALVLALAIGVETYFSNSRWPFIALIAVGGATIVSILLMLGTTLPAPGYALDPVTGLPTAGAMPGRLRLLTPFLNVTGAFSLVLGAVFSTYEFMPKRRVLAYSLDPAQNGDQFLFNLLISPIAIAVNLVASIPAAVGALVTGKLHSRVPATILIALGGFLPAVGDSLVRFGYTGLHEIGLFFGVLLLFAGFLVSAETFRDFRVPFTRIHLGHRRSADIPR